MRMPEITKIGVTIIMKIMFTKSMLVVLVGLRSGHTKIYNVGATTQRNNHDSEKILEIVIVTTETFDALRL